MFTIRKPVLYRVAERVLCVLLLTLLILPFSGCGASSGAAGKDSGKSGKATKEAAGQDANENKVVTFVYENDSVTTKVAPETLATAETLQTAEAANPPVRGITITSDLVFRRNEHATLSINADPGVEYTITIYYNSGESEAEGLEPKVADADGNVSWTWRIGGRTAPGTYKVIIQGNGEIIEREFTVVTD